MRLIGSSFRPRYPTHKKQNEHQKKANWPVSRVPQNGGRNVNALNSIQASLKIAQL